MYKMSVVFLYTSMKRRENEIKETVPFTIETKRIKHLGVNLAKEVQTSFYAGNYKTMQRKIKNI